MQVEQEWVDLALVEALAVLGEDILEVVVEVEAEIVVSEHVFEVAFVVDVVFRDLLVIQARKINLLLSVVLRVVDQWCLSRVLYLEAS